MSAHHRIAKCIHLYYQQQSITCVDIDIFEAFLTLLFQEAGQDRGLNKKQIASINRAITNTPTGKQRLLKRARDEALQYFIQVCDWTLPPAKVQQFKDHDHLWIVSLYKRSALAHEILIRYEQASLNHIKQRGEPSLAWTFLTMMIEVAPLPLNYWCDRFNDPTPLERIGDQITITITHLSNLSYFDANEPCSFTRYALSPLAARAFYNWQQIPDEARINVTLTRLLQALNMEFLPANRSKLTSYQWQQAIQTLWLNRFAIPLEILKDFSDPMRHVSELSIDLNSSHSERSNVMMQSSPSTNVTSHNKHHDLPFHRWPHVQLIKSYNNTQKSSPSQPDWQASNLLPRLLFDYVQDLIEFGGVNKDNLSQSTLTRYTSFKSELSNAPLSSAIVETKESLQTWAENIYLTIPDDTMEKWSMYQFFRFLTQQPITEHLDLSNIVKPSQSIKIDALTLSAEEVHHLITQIFMSDLSPMQALFTAVSAILSYYGALRRGEVLRLRLQDIRCTQEKGQTFTLYISNTTEGKTKNRSARTVSIVIPKVGAKLIRLLLAFKACRPTKEPFIGFQGESIHLRARHYLLPITKLLKQNHGKKARFHHLRHSGAKLLYQQALCLANNETPETWQPCHLPLTKQLLSTSIVAKRFEYWLQGRDFSELNNMLLFDEIGRMLGHQYYATTRLHYLHGMEWVAPAFLPQKRTYSHAELRYLWGMKPDSNDIARILTDLCDDYSQLSLLDKKRHNPSLDHITLTKKISSRLQLPRSSDNQGKTHPYNDKNHPDWLSLWTHKIVNITKTEPHHFQWETREQLSGLNTQPENFSQVSEAWRAFGQYQGLKWRKSERTALLPLGQLHVEASKKFSDINGKPGFQEAYFLTPCNQKVAKALNMLKQSALHYRCHITLHQNRKQLDSHKWRFIQESLLRGNDTARKVIIPTGKTHLKITLMIELSNSALLTHFQTWWNTMIAHNL